MENITHVYFYLFIFFLAAFLLTAGMVKFAAFLSRKLFDRCEKQTENDGYAGGFYILSPVTVRFPVRFAFIALLLVLFNAELLLLLPWAMSLRLSSGEGMATAMLVILSWGLGYFYEYKKGALEWK
ncbi:MAG: NADH-quinone oxidoreductase subunit A [Alphaproteobacteria bacterium]|nr:NADH-quinone oxidoreductase subunit A [Alphaproteobacteria bacterium]MBO4644448.1 NADH-quinone oxidoreductase subunit A [Alphaproteobacteria bacterium]